MGDKRGMGGMRGCDGLEVDGLVRAKTFVARRRQREFVGESG